MKIIPTIFEKEFAKAEEKILLVKDLVDWMQVDVTDGFFVDGKTFELELLSRIKETDKCLYDIHLMVNNPVKWINKCVFAGATRIIGHVEAMENRDNFVDIVKNEGLEVGLAYDIDTDIDENIHEDVDVVLLMARKAGFGDYKLDDKVFTKIKKAIEIRDELSLNYKIGIDGGVSLENIKRLEEVGGDIAYCGSAVFNGVVTTNLENLKNA